MIHIRPQCHPRREGFNFYPLWDGYYGFMFKLGRFYWHLRYKKVQTGPRRWFHEVGFDPK